MNETTIPDGDDGPGAGAGLPPYDYNPRTDALTVQLRPHAGATLEAPLEGEPRVTVTRDAATGTAVALRVAGVQAMLLERIVRDLAERVASGGLGDAAHAVSPERTPAVEAEAPALEAAPGVALEVEAQPAAVEPTSGPEADVPAIEVSPISARGAEAAILEAAPTTGPEADTPTMPVARSNGFAEPDAPPADDASAAGFADLGLDPRLMGAIAAMGFDEPTPIQRRTIPMGLSGADVIGLAQTGTGKTLAFLAPTLHRILARDHAGHAPRLLALTPTRELAVQVAEEAERLTTKTSLRVTTVYGGAGMSEQTIALKRGVDVVVATPGRLLDHLRRGNVSLDTIEVLVIDEADRMLDMGFLDEIRDIIRRLPRERQTLLFGATMPPAIQTLSADFQKSPEVVEVARQLPPESIVQVLLPLGRHLKVPGLLHLLATRPEMTSVLVFTETKQDADVLARQLGERGISVAHMHGDRRQRDREEALESLREGRVRVLVATNVAARGLDIDNVTDVVNFDVPQTVDEYVHRIGRTARAGADGRAFTLVTLGDEPMISRIESALERQLPREQVEGLDYDVPVPSWAKPSAEDLMSSLRKPRSLSDFSRGIR